MISTDNLHNFLTVLRFSLGDNSESPSSFRKTINGATLEIDTLNQKIIYPEAQGLVVNERQTCNFSSNENFVVFECVHRLLEKGYKPEHIELEPKWKLGHGASGGRADILVKDNDDKPLLIIECKTPGAEFERAWRKTCQDGDQLFSYAQQISETQFLCLYCSDFDGFRIDWNSRLIAHRDNSEYLERQPQLLGYKDATSVAERFRVWRDTYQLEYASQGLFEQSIQPYLIGKAKYALGDLKTTTADDQQKKYHEFATILRQHNVSGRENAFDKLVNLFLCKIVDETNNPNDLKFHWKGLAYDTHFELMDRLQELYKEGMGKFLGEPITYINQDQLFNAMRFIRRDMDATQRAVWELFVQQKFFTNNDFSFIDVHNEPLFYQNAEILLKILRMWQDIRLTNPDGHNQFLGDMFEGFLDQGVKQSEGQYFTPMPICRFIMMSLPLESLVRDHATPPKAIDYACGAGHFLNELALQIKPLAERHKPHTALADYHRAIFGIEKEYRLSKVAKVSAFMYGQQDINICYGDALVRHHEAFKDIRDNSFDLLVANPPYSVRGFLETLADEERAAYSLSKTVERLDSSNSIEAFFIERAKQLLRAGGVAAIILPASILSNGGNTYIKTREILLQYFDIVAIVEFGSGTFGKTGTNTVTLFLRRKQTAPDTAAHYRERVAEWFAADSDQAIYQDAQLIERYASHIGVPLPDYKTLLGNAAQGAWREHEHFAVYAKAFAARSEVKALRGQKRFKGLGATEQSDELDKRYLAFVREIERDKLYHFVMASEQSNTVLVVKSPADNKAQKQFLGYDWSSAKGDEGIKLMRDAEGRHVTPLYDEHDRDNATKLNRCIADNFDGKLAAVPEALGEFASTARLVDMLDFKRVNFEKQIILTPKKSVYIFSQKFPMERLSNLSSMLRRGKASGYGNSSIQIIKSGQARGNFEFDFSERYFVDEKFKADERLLRSGDLLINSTGKGTAGRVTYFDLPGEFAVDSHISILRANEKLNPKYGLYSLARIGFKSLESLAHGSSGQIELSLETIGEIEIPLPPLNIQQQIVSECEAVDNAVTEAQAAILQSQAAIVASVTAVYESTAPFLSVDQLSRDVQYGLSEKMNETGVGYKIFRMNEIIQGRMADNGAMKCADIPPEEFAKYRLNRGDLLFNRTNSIEHVGKTGLFELDGDYCFASYLVRVVPDTEQVLPLFLCLMMNSTTFQQEAKSKASKSINQANINATIMRNLKVPVPTLNEQRRVVAEIEKLQQKIATAQGRISAASAQKQAILQHHL